MYIWQNRLVSVYDHLYTYLTCVVGPCKFDSQFIVQDFKLGVKEGGRSFFIIHSTPVTICLPCVVIHTDSRSATASSF